MRSFEKTLSGTFSRTVMKKSLKVGVLGAGAMGRTVIQHLQGIPEVSGIIAYDVVSESLSKTEEECGVRVTTDLDVILKDPAIRLVFITSSNQSHRDLALQAIQAGKAVMCEKPMANTLEDAHVMVEAAEQSGTFFQVGFELRYSKLYSRIKEWIDAGLLGQVVSVHCLYGSSAYAKDAWRNTKEEGGSTFGERLSHYVDLTRWWIDSPVTEVYSACAPNVVPYTKVHDNYHTTYRFASGAVGHISYFMNFPATYLGDPQAPNITDLQLGDGHELRQLIVGTKGAAETDVFRRQIKRWAFSDAPDKMLSEWVDTLTWKAEEDHVYYHNTSDQTRDIVRRVLAGEPPMTSGRDAYQTMQLCFAAEQSADTGLLVDVRAQS